MYGGEGRLNVGVLITGFWQALNLNKFDKWISNGTQIYAKIPNLLPVADYYKHEFDIDDKMVTYITLMGSPIEEVTAHEMCRVLKPDGIVILWVPDVSPNIFEKVAKDYGIISVNTDHYKLNAPFNEITIKFTPKVFSSSTAFLNIGLP